MHLQLLTRGGVALRCIKISDYGFAMADRSKGSDFHLEEQITFGYSYVCRSRMEISKDGLSARKRNPDDDPLDGVVYGDKPLKGVSEFEVEIVRYGSKWPGSIAFGVMKISKGKKLTVSDVPVVWCVNAPNHFVWYCVRLYNNFEVVTTRYGNRNLRDLREGNRVGLRLDRNGNLSFLVDGRSQGVACRNIVSEDHNLFVVVDHYGGCVETRITRSGK